MKHLDSRSDFSTDEEFANFRALILNNKKSTIFYRSASAISNRYGRAETVQKIIRDNHINTIIDLSSLHCECKSVQFGETVVMLLREALAKPTPYIVQCDAGKKRTGFLCIILEALSSTSYENIIEDYLKSYVNNNGLDLAGSPKAVKKIIQQKIDSHIDYIKSFSQNPELVNLKQAAVNYLLHFGMTQTEIANLQQVLH